MEIKCTNAQITRYRVSRSRILIYSIFCVFFIFLSLFACKSVRIKDAEAAYKSQFYAESAKMYHTLYRRTPRKEKEKRAYFSFKIAESYRFLQNPLRAKNAYLIAKNNNYPDSIVYLRIAQMEQKLGKLEDAKEHFLEFLEWFPKDYFARLGLENCKRIEELRLNKYHYLVKKAKRLSSSRSDFGGAFSPDGKAFYFTSARNRNPEIEKSRITGEKPNDLYFTAQNSQGKWSRVDSVSGGINSYEDEGMPCISSDGSAMYYTYGESSDYYDRTAKIYKASKSGEGAWSKGQKVAIWGETDSLKMAAHPALSASQKKLYFVSEGGQGKKDIYVIDIDTIGVDQPTNLGAIINTSGNEISPTMVGDSTLYFASDGHLGLGGYDLYRADLLANGDWKLSNLGAPLNSSFDDFAISFNPQIEGGENLAEGYISSSRDDARGYPHLYEFRQKAIRVFLEGNISDREGNPIQGAFIRLVNKKDPTIEGIASSKNTGDYLLELKANTEHILLVGAEGYLNEYAIFRTEKCEDGCTYQLDFQLASRSKPEVFSDIFYAFDSAELLSESKADLERIVKILEDNPEITIEISSHADRVGSDSYNNVLSEKRANSVVKYLISQGIASHRLFSKGCGKKSPRIVSEKLHTFFEYLPIGISLDEEFVGTLTKEQQDVCDRLNRRTEFKVKESKDD